MAAYSYALLIRGINVGGKNKLPMGDLRVLLESLGHEDVVTYIQSGNIVLRSRGSAIALAREVERAISDRFDLAVTAIVRTPGELERVAASNPFLDRESNHSRLHVVYLDRKPPVGAVERLDPERSPGDELAVAGREIYLHYPNGSGRSKLTLDYFERTLGVRGTARNWNTLLKLIALLGP